MLFTISFLLIIFKLYFSYILFKEKNLKKSLIYGFVFGLLSWSFLFTMLPLSEIKEPSPIIDFLFTLIIVMALAIPNSLYGLVSFVNRKLRRLNIFIRAIIFGIYLSSIELIISSCISIMMNKSIVPDYAFTNIGFALAHSPLVYFAKFGHIYVLTFLVGLIVALLTQIKSKKYRYTGMFISLLFCLSFYTSSEEEVNLQNDRILIREEDSRMVNFLNREELSQKYDLIVDGNTETAKNGMYNVSNIYDFKNGDQYIVYKRFLMPFGEFFPWGFSFLKYINPDLYQSILDRHNYISVDKNKVFEFGGKRFGVLICSDAWSPVTTSNIKDQNPDYVILQRRERLFHDRALYEANVLMWKRVLESYFDKPVIDKRI